MRKAKKGDNVQIHYKGWLDDGSEFDSSSGSGPLQFPLGAGKVIEGVEKAITGMSVGEKKKVDIPVEEAYGPHRKELIGEVPREQFPKDIQLEPGQRLQLANEEDHMHVFQVVSVGDGTVEIDMNHPLAGENLTFELELVSIVEATE